VIVSRSMLPDIIKDAFSQLHLTAATPDFCTMHLYGTFRHALVGFALSWGIVPYALGTHRIRSPDRWLWHVAVLVAIPLAASVDTGTARAAATAVGGVHALLSRLLAVSCSVNVVLSLATVYRPGHSVARAHDIVEHALAAWFVVLQPALGVSAALGVSSWVFLRPLAPLLGALACFFVSLDDSLVARPHTFYAAEQAFAWLALAGPTAAAVAQGHVAFAVACGFFLATCAAAGSWVVWLRKKHRQLPACLVGAWHFLAASVIFSGRSMLQDSVHSRSRYAGATCGTYYGTLMAAAACRSLMMWKGCALCLSFAAVTLFAGDDVFVVWYEQAKSDAPPVAAAMILLFGVSVVLFSWADTWTAWFRRRPL